MYRSVIISLSCTEENKCKSSQAVERCVSHLANVLKLTVAGSR